MDAKQQQAFHDRVVLICSEIQLTATDFRAWAQREGCHYRFFFRAVYERLYTVVRLYNPVELVGIFSWGIVSGESFEYQGVTYKTSYADAWYDTELPYLLISNPGVALLRILAVAIISAGMFDYLKHQAESLGDLRTHHGRAEIMAAEGAGQSWQA